MVNNMNSLNEILKKYYGYESFRDGQEKIINNISYERPSRFFK